MNFKKNLRRIKFAKVPTAKKGLTSLMKVVGTLLSCYFIGNSVSWAGTRRAFANFSVGWFILAVFVFWIAQFLSTLRCVYVARALGERLDFSTSIRANFIGLWFNQILPTGLGGDFVRVAILKNRVGLSVGVRIILLDRILGLIILLLMLSIQMPFYWLWFGQAHEFMLISYSSFGALFMLAIVSVLAKQISNKFKLPFGVHYGVELLIDIWRSFRGNILAEQFGTSLGIYMSGVLSFILVGLTFGIYINFVNYLLLVPIIFLLGLIPFSWAGWGVREVASIWVLSMAGISKEAALAVSLGFGALLLISGVPGFVIWALKK